MRIFSIVLLGALLSTTPVWAQNPAEDPDSAQVTPPPTPGPHGPAEPPPRIYFGGNLGLSIGGSSTRISFQPMMGVRVTKKISLGGRLSYEYVRYKVGEIRRESHNYGGSTFGRYRIIPQAYAQVEFQAMNFEVQRASGDEREWVPFLLLGGGYVRQLGPKTSAYLELLVDVLQDPDSPYGWDPVLNAGVAVGF